MGGENVGLLKGDQIQAGSSPRGRGKRSDRTRQPRRSRLIPAWAGKTHPPPGKACPPSAHPRVGGENSSRVKGKPALQGSSPRGRGKLAPSVLRPAAFGLIPAWAGKTGSADGRDRPRSAHPRVGGENRSSSTSSPGRLGSSPRGRGKPRGNLSPPDASRLIPAWAGKTGPCGDGAHDDWAHPRVGGENVQNMDCDAIPRGSSPRGRGKPGIHHGTPVKLRLIPAWAGKTRTPTPSSSRAPAHPRVGGENSEMNVNTSASTGSSPRGRGKPWSDLTGTARPRLIPAWAGKTLSDLRFYRADRSDLGNP